MSNKIQAITKPFMILCEGSHDRHFFESLMKHHGISGFQVCSNHGLSKVHGNTAFGRSLDAMTVLANFENLRGVLIFTDSDDDPDDTFGKVANQISTTSSFGEDLNLRFPRPDKPGEIAAGRPALAIRLLPSASRKGNLETMLMEAIRQEHPGKAACVDRFAECMGSNEWLIGPTSKMMARSMTSAFFRQEPDKGLAKLWDCEEGKVLAPLASDAFADVVGWIRSFSDAIVRPG